MESVNTSEQPIVPEKEKVSTPNHLQLIEYKPENFAGIREEMGFVLSLKSPIIGLEGDQGLCKTSLLNGLICLMGGDEAVNSLNVSISKGKRVLQRSASLTFKDVRKPEVTYETRLTNKSFSVKKIELTEGNLKPVTSTVDSPKSFLRDLFGPLGTSPMILKEKNGKEQIEWIRAMTKFTHEQLEAEKKISDSLSSKFKLRTAVNKEVKQLRVDVGATRYFDWDEENKCFVPSLVKKADEKDIADNLKDEAALTLEMQQAQEKIRQRDLGVTTMDQLSFEKKKTDEDIADLEKQLKEKKEKLVSINERIEKGKEYNKQFEKAQEEFDLAQKNMMAQGELKVKQTKLASASDMGNKFELKLAEQLNLNVAIDELKVLKKKFIEMFTPKIEGLKLIIKDGIDSNNSEGDEENKENPDKDLEEGLYYNGRAMVELSESELWAFFMLLCKEFDIRFLFIENAQSLGSDAAQTINWFVKEGYGQVFYTAMIRGQKELQITFNGEFN